MRPAGVSIGWGLEASTPNERQCADVSVYLDLVLDTKIPLADDSRKMC